MKSAILKIASTHLKWIIVTFSVFILIRGHNYPGGGFIGGILAGTGILFEALAYGFDKANKHVQIDPLKLISFGLLICFVSAIPGEIISNALLTGYWLKIDAPIMDTIKLGTPLLFDTGIYLVVSGSFLLTIFSIMEELQWK